MAKGKNLPAVDFHAVIARRDPVLAERLAREGITHEPPVVEPAPPALTVVVSPPVPMADPREVAFEGDMPSDPVQAEAPSSETGGGEEASRTRMKTGVRPKVTPTRRRGVVQRAGGREAGRITVYVPSELALRLRQFCFEHDRSMTDVAGEILIEALEQRLRRGVGKPAAS